MVTTSSPPVSVVVTVFGRSAYLEEALESILAQDYPGELEVIVVDDGSPTEVAQLFRGRYPEVRWLRQSNSGVCAARQTGSEHASHDLIAYLDDDDTWHPNKVSFQIQSLAELPWLGFLCTDLSAPTSLGEPGEGYFCRHGLLNHARAAEGPEELHCHWFAETELFDFMLSTLPLSPPSLLVKRDALDSIGGWDRELGNHADCHDFFLRANFVHKVGFLNIPLTGVRRGHLDHLTADVPLAYYKDALGLLQACERYPDALAREVRRRFDAMLTRTGRLLRRAGRHRLAAEAYLRLLKDYGVTARRLALFALTTGTSLLSGEYHRADSGRGRRSPMQSLSLL